MVGCPWVAPTREGEGKLVDVAAATSDEPRADVEELSSGADGVGVQGEGLALGNRPHDEMRLMAQDGRAESARLARGQQKDMEWRENVAGWFSTRARAQLVDRGLQVDVGAASQKVDRCGRWFGRIVYRWMATTEQVVMQRQVTTVGTVAKFWDIARQQRVKKAKQEEEKNKQGRQRKQQEGRQRNRWYKVGKAAVQQGAQPMERARVMVQAICRLQRAEQGQLLLQAADRGVEGARFREVLARTLYRSGACTRQGTVHDASWGVGRHDGAE